MKRPLHTARSVFAIGNYCAARRVRLTPDSLLVESGVGTKSKPPIRNRENRGGEKRWIPKAEQAVPLQRQVGLSFEPPGGNPGDCSNGDRFSCRKQATLAAHILFFELTC